MTIIHRITHTVEWQDGVTENWMGEDWAVVPPELAKAARESGGFCELTFDEEGNLTGLTPTEKPPAPEPEPTEGEQLRADVDYIAAMTGVSL
ncbi:hypothetical protein [Vermiculatibacterium agrestimuris]|uniref:hypothetical protein n=1 Tax=Vermiculatibacterium agrestimuris TaxID=2941519 RepID=UPI0020407BBF|nr:hypothetical protein [Vermiculatibacterium agrestimuris]